MPACAAQSILCWRHHEQANTFIESPAFSISDLDEKHEPLAGQTVGNFTIIQLLGEGGLGQVYPAQDNKLGRKVALKFLPSFYTKDKNRLRRFTQEARSVTPSMNLPAMKCN